MKFRLFLKSFNTHLILKAAAEIKELFTVNNYSIIGPISLPLKIKKFCLLRSPHVNKDSREHFEMRIYKKFFDITPGSPLEFNKLLTKKLPAGVSYTLKLL